MTTLCSRRMIPVKHFSRQVNLLEIRHILKVKKTTKMTKKLYIFDVFCFGKFVWLNRFFIIIET